MSPPGAFSTYKTGDLVLQVQADLPVTAATFHPSIQKFRVDPTAGADAVLRHHFSLPGIAELPHGAPIYRKVPWAVYDLGDSFAYLGISDEARNTNLHTLAFFSKDHTAGEIYHRDEQSFLRGNCTSITLFPTDQILTGRLLSDHQGGIFHAAGLVLEGQGLLFVGHSGAGKSTLSRLLRRAGTLLCDDRCILRRREEGWRVYGTWSHGDIPEVSPESAPLRAILLLEQAPETRLIPLPDRREIVRRLPFYIIKPLVTAGWWEKTLDLVGQAAREVPVYRLRFEKSERVLDALRPLLG